MIFVSAIQNLKNRWGRSPLFLVLAAIIFIVLGAFVWNKSYLYSQNSLLAHPQWRSYKSLVSYPPAYHIESLIGRVDFSGNRFNVLPTYGHQKIFSTTGQNLKAYSVDVRIKSRGYIDLLFNADDKRFSGVRISRNDLFPCLFYESTQDGTFLSSISFDKPFDNGRKHTITLTQVSESEISLSIDSRIVQTFRKNFSVNKEYGFYTSLQDLEIFSVKMTDRDGSVKLFDFENRDRETIFLFKNLALLTAIVLCLSFVFFVFNRLQDFPRILYKTAQFVFCLGVFWYSFDYFYYSRIAQRFSYVPFQFNSINGSFYYLNFEANRISFFKNWQALLGEPVLTIEDLIRIGVQIKPLQHQFCHGMECSFIEADKKWVAPVKKPSTKRIMYLGGSFAAGAGAETNDRGFFYLNQKNITELLKTNHLDQDLESLNISEGGFKLTPETLAKVKSQIESFQPDYLYLTYFLGSDEDMPLIEELIKYARAKSIQSIVMLPPNDSENGDFSTQQMSIFAEKDLDKLDQVNLSYKQRLLRLRNLGSFIINPNAVLNSFPVHDGIYWWDFTHPTPYGTQILSKRVSPILYDHLFAKKSEASKDL